MIGNLARTGRNLFRHLVTDEKFPVFLSYAITFRCNSDCRYCDLPPVKKELSFEEFKPLLDRFRELGLVRLGFTGGEPLMHPDVGRTIRHCRSIGIMTVMSTNGRLVPDRLDEISDLDLASISIDAGEETDDKLRGRGSFSAALDAADLLSGRGVGIVLSAVLSAGNLDRIDDLLGEAKRLGAATVWQPYFRPARLLDSRDPNLPDVEQFRQTVNRIIRVKLRHPRLVASSLPYLRFIRDHYPVYDTAFCRAGKLFFALSPDGKLFPCYPLTGRMEGLGVTTANLEQAIKGFEDIRCTTPCYCNGHLENGFLFGLNPLSLLDVMINLASFRLNRRRRIHL